MIYRFVSDVNAAMVNFEKSSWPSVSLPVLNVSLATTDLTDTTAATDSLGS